MKKKYVKPISMVVVMADALCQGEFKFASMINGKTKESVDRIDIENENVSKDKYNWDDTNSWGGD